MVTDQVADLLTRIRNAAQRDKKSITMPKTKLAESVVKVMVTQKFLSGYDVVGNPKTGERLVIGLKYVNNRPVFEEIKKVSKPGNRVYTSYKDLKTYMGGLGIIILSTPAGVMSAKDAKSKKVGGEILCKIW